MELDYDYIAKLVRKTQEGDSDAFAELYTATYQSQYRFAYQYVKDPYLAQDILQEVYILVLKNLDTLKNPRLFVSGCTRSHSGSVLTLGRKGNGRNRNWIIYPPVRHLIFQNLSRIS